MTSTTENKKIIVFPSGMPESVTFIQNNADKELIGASAISNDKTNDLYSQWQYLPYVDTAEFDSALLSLIRKTEPDEIYCPHRFASYYVKKTIKNNGIKIKLIGTGDEKIAHFKQQQESQWYQSYKEITLKYSIQNKNRLSKTEVIAVIRHSLAIPGETGEEKIIALLAIGHLIPVGDVVEIGCLYGRTSFVFGWLAQRYNIGATLCVDPWSTEAAIHEDTSSMARDAIRENYEYNSIFQLFKENLIPSFYKTVNYLRSTSHEAAITFSNNKRITTSEFGETQYAQNISCLHIDGNHDFSAVLDDLMQWNFLLNGNAWLILDDYNWPFGDGPKKVGDEVLKTNQEAIEYSFISGDALFIRLKKKINTDLLFENLATKNITSNVKIKHG